MGVKSVAQKVDGFLSLSEGQSKQEIEESMWANDDIRPMPESRRTWGMWSYFSFWAINNLALSNWQTGGSLIALGLSVWMAMISTIIARVVIALVAVFNGWVGAEYHIGFPVLSRYIWGMYGHYLALIQRIVLSLVWFSIQSWTGGLCVSVILSAIFPSYFHMHNTLPASAHMETKEFVGFVVYCIISCFILYMAPEKTNLPFFIFNCITFVTLLGILIWSVVTAGGAGPLMSASATVTGSSETGWAIVSGVTTVIGSIAVGLTNQSDYTRFAKKPGDQLYGQGVSIMFFGTVIPLMGCITTSAISQIYGVAIWNPPDIAAQWLIADYNSKSRAGAFFAGVGLLTCQLAINTIDNAFSFGMDLAGLIPRYVNIRRGSYIALVISVLMQPWQLLASAGTFVSVMGAYTVFLGPMTGIMVCDFWVVRKRKLKLTDLYKPKSTSIYWFTKGWNLRTLVSWVVGWAPILPGFINDITPSISVPEGSKHLFNIAYIYGFAVSFTVHYLLNWAFPPQGLGELDEQDFYHTFNEDEVAKHVTGGGDWGVIEAADSLTSSSGMPEKTEYSTKVNEV